MRFTNAVTAGLVLAAISSLTSAGVVPHSVRSKTESDVTIADNCAHGKGLCAFVLPIVNKQIPVVLRPGKGWNGDGGGVRPGGSEGGGNPRGDSSQIGDQTGPGQSAGEGSGDSTPQTGDPAGTGDPAKTPGETTSNIGDTKTNPDGSPTKSDDDIDTDISCVKKRCADPDQTLARINRPLDYSTAQQNGQSVLADAESRIAENKPKGTFADPSRGYFLTRDTDPDSDGFDDSSFFGDSIDHKEIFDDDKELGFKIDPNTRAPTLEFNSQVGAPSNGQIAPNTAVNNAKINSKEGLMIASVRDKSADGNVVAHPDQVVPSHELSWRMWEKQCADDGEPLSNLRLLVAEAVQGRGTQDTLVEAIRLTQSKNGGVDLSLPKGDDINNKAVFTPDPNNPNMMAAFKAMAGTDNVRPFVQMVAQNHAALKDQNGNAKVITKIIVYGNGPSSRSESRFQGPDIAILLGPMPDTPLFNVPS